MARAEDLVNFQSEKPSSKDKKVAQGFTMYKLQTYRHLNKAPKELTDVARMAVPVYVATRVLKVSEQKLSTT
jgi:hypothetical protein